MLVDLHVHLRGTLTRDLVARLADRNNVQIPREMLECHRYGWTDFPSFLNAYDLVTAVVKSARDLEEVTLAYLADCASAGGAYVEFMLSPPDLARCGVAFEDQLAAIAAAKEQGEELHGITCRLIATAVRHLGPEAAVAAARMAVSRSNDLLVGFGLTGNETRFSAAEFREAFRIARSEGLSATAHAGEHLPAETILEAIECLELDRVGHGVRAVESPSVLRQLASAQTPLEVCISSNLALGLYPGIAEHPLSALVDAGCRVVLGTDDPGFFDTTLAEEYEAAVSSHAALSAYSISAAAIEAAFCSESVKASLRERLSRADSGHLDRSLEPA